MEPGGLRLALAGGGTGGHIVPGLHLLAHADARARAGDGRPLADLLWFTSGRPVEERVFAGLDDPRLERVPLALEPAGGGAPRLSQTALRALPETVRARNALRRHGSQVLLGLGGFTCLPAVLAARTLGLPCALLEINAVSGRATRSLARTTRRVFHAWPATLPVGTEGGDPTGRHRLTGAPLSPAFRRRAPGDEGEAAAAAARASLGFDPARPLLAVLGGSQGAGGLNAFVGAHAAAWVREGLQVLHQTGPGRAEEHALDLPGVRQEEYLTDVPAVLEAATLVLCRGGASTLAEVAAVGVPAWVVPYPHHADRHQARNAQQLGEGVRCVEEADLDADAARDLLALAGEAGRGERAAMARALATGGDVPAAVLILEELEALARLRGGGADGAG